MVAFANAIEPTPENPMGALAKLKYLFLTDNQVGDEGIKAFASAIASGALGSCQVINLRSNNIGEAGMQAFSDAIRSGALGLCTTIYLGENKIGDVGMQALATAVSSGALPAFKKIVVPDGLENHPALVAACKPRGIEIV